MSNADTSFALHGRHIRTGVSACCGGRRHLPGEQDSHTRLPHSRQWCRLSTSEKTRSQALQVLEEPLGCQSKHRFAAMYGASRGKCRARRGRRRCGEPHGAIGEYSLRLLKVHERRTPWQDQLRTLRVCTGICLVHSDGDRRPSRGTDGSRYPRFVPSSSRPGLWQHRLRGSREVGILLAQAASSSAQRQWRSLGARSMLDAGSRGVSYPFWGGFPIGYVS